MADAVTQEVTPGFTLVAVIVYVDARAQRLAEHPEVATQGGSSDSLKRGRKHHVGKELVVE